MKNYIKQDISKQFTAKELLYFSIPAIIMMIFLSLYTIVDGIFVSRYVNTNALSAINITYPLTSLFIAIGVMFSTGGSSIIAKQIGEQRLDKANRSFSMITCFSLIISIIGVIICFLFLEPILTFLGANSEVMPLCKQYIRILLLFFPMSILQMLFQNFLVVASRPGLGLLLTIAAGCTNMVLDYIFITHYHMGIEGAAYATVLGYCISAIGGIIFFLKNKTGLHFVLFQWKINTIIKSCTNGSSEMVTNLSTSITTLLFNVILMRMIGINGVAAITVIMYCQFLMTALFMGFSIGVTPIFSYHFGADNKIYLHRLKKICFYFIGFTSLLIFTCSILLTERIAYIFSTHGTQTYELICRGMTLFSFSFLFSGFNIFASAMFTALSDGITSALISFARTFLFIIIGITLLTYLFGLDGLWLSIPFAEAITMVFAFVLVRRKSQI